MESRRTKGFICSCPTWNHGIRYIMLYRVCLLLRYILIISRTFKTILAFRKHFRLEPKYPAPSRNTVKAWVENFNDWFCESNQASGSCPNRQLKTSRATPNFSCEQSPSRSGKEHLAALRDFLAGFPPPSESRTMRFVISSLSYKIAITRQQQLKLAAYRLIFANKIIEMLDRAIHTRPFFIMRNGFG